MELKVGAKIKERPSESVGLAGGGLGAAVSELLHLSASQTRLILILVGALPAVVTYLVTHGGIRGTLGKLWHG